MNKLTQLKMRKLRDYLKDDVRKRTDFSQTDQTLGVEMPAIQLPPRAGSKPVPLPEWRGALKPEGSLDALIGERKSYRRYLDTPLDAEELSFLLWATQGVRKDSPGRVLRNVPSAGNRHPCETYLALTQPVPGRDGKEAFPAGLWHYLPLEHALERLGSPENLPESVSAAALDQAFVGRAPAVFFWACVPYRTEWRYAEASHKVIALDAGHICQNLYLAAGAIGCGTCAVAAYDQPRADALLGLDGEDEFVIYMAPVGKVR